MTTTISAPLAGFDAPVRQSQTVFRAVMAALAEPGRLVTLDTRLVAPSPLQPAAAAVLLALADYETPIWLDAAARTAEAETFLRFHTGAAVVAEPSAAAFALHADVAGFEGLDRFAQGTLDYPDRSTTVILQLDAVGNDGPLRLVGPGIAGERTLGLAPTVPGLPEALARNHAGFPLGVDLVLVAGSTIVGLPRSTRVTV